MRSRSPGNPAKDYAGDRRRKKGVDPSQNRDFRVEPSGTAPPEERAALIGVGMDARADDAELPVFDELAELARTAGARVVLRFYQRKANPESSAYLGKGKLEALAEQLKETGATLIIADDDLTPAQVRNLEKVTCVRVIDRSELIIDIFAKQARTEQAKLQVELAQLQYMAPRLRRMWTHLSRITGAGGIGSRGPGEKQLEVDRRIVKRKIEDLRAKLEIIEARKEREVKGRRDAFKVALVGYTNAGKSTMMHALTGADVYIADRLFATLDTRTRKFELEDGTGVLLSDTVGFIDKLPHHLVASFNATLAEVTGADLLLHIVDASDDAAVAKIGCVRDVLGKIGAASIPELVLLNKCDRVNDVARLEALRSSLGEHLVVSALTGHGLDGLRARVRGAAAEFEDVIDLDMPAGDGALVAALERMAAVREREYRDDRVLIKASIPRVHRHRFEAWIVSPKPIRRRRPKPLP